MGCSGVWDTLLGKFLGIITLVHVWGLKVGKDGRGKLGGNFSKVTALASQPHVFWEVSSEVSLLPTKHLKAGMDSPTACGATLS